MGHTDGPVWTVYGRINYGSCSVDSFAYVGRVLPFSQGAVRWFGGYGRQCDRSGRVLGDYQGSGARRWEVAWLGRLVE